MTKLTTEELRELLRDRTPGLWGVDGDGDVVAPKGCIVAGIFVLDGRPSSQDTANARLIGSAPDLADEVLTLRAEVERLREALEPFATCLSRYKFSEHQLILLSEDNPKGRRLNHLRPANFDRARAALGEGDNQ